MQSKLWKENLPQEQYKVEFIGLAVKQDKLEFVKLNLASLFKTQTEKLEPLFGDKPMIIKKYLTRDEARHYQDAIQKAGAVCRITLMDNTHTQFDKVKKSEFDSDDMTCPRCYRRQMRAAVCKHCETAIQHFDADSAYESLDSRPVRHSGDRRVDLETSLNIYPEEERRSGMDRRLENINQEA